MIRLEEKDLRTAAHQSSKGNQLKWESEGVWYKADYTGYEGLAEYVVSKLLRYSNMEENDYILYETEEIRYKQAIYRGCRSRNFLPDGWQLITLERLFSPGWLAAYHVGEIVQESVWAESVCEHFPDTGCRGKDAFSDRAGGADDGPERLWFLSKPSVDNRCAVPERGQTYA